MSHYQTRIREIMARQGNIGAADPRHVEAWMRCESPTLDGLSAVEFGREVALATQTAMIADAATNETLAEMVGLGVNHVA